MEWRQQTSVSCADAFSEAQRWIEEVTGKSFGCDDFRAALENGVLLCDLINQLNPGIIKRVNRLSTPIAGLDNVTVFLKACSKLGLNVSQLFHPGDLQDLSTRATFRRDESNRRLKNVLITIYWLGRKAHLNTFYSGPQLNFKAFEGLLGLALSKALDESGIVFMKDSWDQEKDEKLHSRTPSYRTDSVDGVDPLYSRALRPNSEGCGSDAEAEQVFKMETAQASTQQNKGYIPPPLTRRKPRWEEDGVLASTQDDPISPQPHLTVSPPETDIDEELFLQASSEEDSGDDYSDPDLVLDDLYFRRVQQTLHQTSANPDYDRFLPRYWTPEEAAHVRQIYLGSQKRPWYHKMLRLRSKSLSDIPMVYPVRKVPDGNSIDNVANDSEAQWQDDLTKWKNRRRSTKSDSRRTLQDRELVVHQMTNGVGTKFDRNAAQGGPLKRDQQSPRRHNPAPHPYSTSPPSKSSSFDLKPRTRALLARSYAIETPFSPSAPVIPQTSVHAQGSSVGAMPASDGITLAEKTHFASLASDGAGVTTPSPEFPFSSQTHVKAKGPLTTIPPTPQPTLLGSAFTNQVSTLTTTLQPSRRTESTNPRETSMLSNKDCICGQTNFPPSGPVLNQARADPLEDWSHQKSQEESQKTSCGPAEEQARDQQTAGLYKYLPKTGSWSGSASLPRGYRRSEGSSRLSSAITARPFGSKSRVSSLPRLCNVDNNQGLLLTGDKDEFLTPPAESSLKRQTAMIHLKASIPQKKDNQVPQIDREKEKDVKGVAFSSQSTLQTNGHQHQPCTQTQPQLQPCSNPQAPHNKSSSFPSNAPTDLQKMDHSYMRVSLTLKPNSRPDFGFQTHWESTGARVEFIQPGSPAELCQLCVGDEIVTVNGFEVAHMNYTQWKDKMSSSLQTGSLTMDVRRYGHKDWSSSDGSRHNQPGQSRMTLNLTAAAPALIGFPDHHSATETTVTKVSKLNGHTNNVMQGKVMNGEMADNHTTARSKDYNSVVRKNQRRRAEFFRWKGGSESAISDLQVPSLSPTSSSWSWDREEDRRRQEKWQEEQERLLQEQYQRDQERLEAEWKKAQQEAMQGSCGKTGNIFAAERTNSGKSSVSTQRHVNGEINKTRAEEFSPDRPDLKESESKSFGNSQGWQEDKTNEGAWADDSCGFAQLSLAHRAKSLSTPALAGPNKPTKGDQRKSRGQSVSQVEKERQRILEEMKKRTQLLTDNSWIRQRSSSFYKEPIYVGVPLKRYESLDNLETFRQSPLSASAFNYSRPHSAAAGYCAPSRNSSSRYSTGTMLPQRNAPGNYSHPSRVSGSRTCCVCERLLGSGAAMVIETLSLCFHLACFQCVGCQRHLGGTETGVQVRVRNRKPYCEPCYFQLKCEYCQKMTSNGTFQTP